ncbi:hypothetical protein ATI61_106401 [Archangium gephyra]|uniref:Lipoprotein n=1 Tax=Archangium gephyra TaxID=48 RepID=A0AAC8TAR7_9BACT|nr:hypothetical protein [Archangium gephyra]AKI99021.1 putative lipoprotein [Archangium gephyra]REG30931.1 hypothetical protein ATI61_106401 [Archangium gephyra]
MTFEMQAPRRSWKWFVLGTLVLAACGAVPEAPEADAHAERSVSAMHDTGDRQRVFPTWSSPTFAAVPAMATDGRQFLTVWRDVLRPSELFGARVSTDGKLLDPDSIRLNLDPTVEVGDPAVAYDGKQFLVVWQGTLTLYLVRVNRDGTVVPPVLPIADIFASPSPAPTIACGWRKCLVAWPDSGDPRGIRGVIVESDDMGLGTRELVISSPAPALSSFGISATWGHDRFLVVWSDERTGSPKLVAARVRSDGTVLDPSGIRVSDSTGVQSFPDVVATKHGFFVAWSDTRLGTRDIFGTLVKPNGSVPDSDGFLIETSPDDELDAAVTYDGSRVLATWSRLSPERFSVRGNFVRADGSLASPVGFALSTGEFVREVQQDVAYADGTHFVAWCAAPVIDEPPLQVILGSRVKKNGALVDDPAIRISHSPSVEGGTVVPEVK